MPFRIERRELGYFVLDDNGNVKGQYASDTEAANGMAALSFPLAWRKKVSASLPKKMNPRRLAPQREMTAEDHAAYRNALTTRIAEHIQTWFSIAPEIDPHQKKLKRLVAAADKLESAVNRINATLSKQGIDISAGRNTADGHLWLIATRSAQDLRTWNCSWRPPKARPQKFSVQLSKTLREDFDLYCGKDTRGFSSMLKAIQDAHPSLQRHQKMPPLPTLTVSALQKRKLRKSRSTKSVKNR